MSREAILQRRETMTREEIDVKVMHMLNVIAKWTATPAQNAEHERLILNDAAQTAALWLAGKDAGPHA